MPQAHHGSLTELAQAVHQQNRSGGFTHPALVKLATAVAEREVFSASDQTTHGSFEPPPIAELSGCAKSLRRSLVERATRADDTAYGARMSLLRGGDPLSEREFLANSTLPQGWARATAALTTDATSRWYFRREALSDPDARVRLAALQAAALVPLEQDRSNLVALLRGAPDLESRAAAAKALGALGGDSAYRVLNDAWSNAEPELRLALVNAFAQPACFELGGQERLQSIARSEPGVVGIAAAVSLFVGKNRVRATGQARITRALDEGSTDEQRLAVFYADWAIQEHAERLVRLGLKGTDRLVRVAALSRWLERADHSWPATMALREIGQGDSTEAMAARSLLAHRGDWSTVQALRDQQRARTAQVRLAAALDLLALGDYNSVALGLADDSPSVRLTLSCVVVQSKPRP